MSTLERSQSTWSCCSNVADALPASHAASHSPQACSTGRAKTAGRTCPWPDAAMRSHTEINVARCRCSFSDAAS